MYHRPDKKLCRRLRAEDSKTLVNPRTKLDAEEELAVAVHLEARRAELKDYVSKPLLCGYRLLAVLRSEQPICAMSRRARQRRSLYTF